MTLKDVLDLGTTGILAVGIVALWARLNIVTDRFFDRIEQGDAERKVLAHEAGLDTNRLSDMAKKVRAARKVDAHNNL